MLSLLSALHILFSIIYISNADTIQCTDGNCHCPSTNTSNHICTLECTEPFMCSQFTITCRPNDPCQIICSNNHACSNLTINSNDAADLKIICSTTNACTDSIQTICETQDCELQCKGNNSCINLSYSSNINHIISSNKSILNISNLSRTNPTILIIIILSLLCCCVIFISLGFNCLYYKMITQRERLLVQKYNNNNSIRSNSVLSPTASNFSPTASHFSPTASNFSPISQPIPTSPIVIATLNNVDDNINVPPVTPVNLPNLKMQTINSGSYDNMANLDGDCNKNIDLYTDNNNNLGLHGIHSTTLSQLPLSMKQPEFKLRMSQDGPKHEPEEEEESISISVTHSYRL